MALTGNRVPGESSGILRARRPASPAGPRASQTRGRVQLEALETRALLAITNITIASINPTEGTPFGTAANPALVATFSVNNYIGIDESSEYSAIVDWGDGGRSAGLSGPTIKFGQQTGNGTATYQVLSNHTYADATTASTPYTLTATIFDNTGPGTSQAQSGPVQVIDATLTPGAGLSLSAVVGAPLTNVDVATFTDANSLATADEYSVSIVWANPAQTTAGTVVRDSSGVFHVQGSHTYTSGAASSPITVTVTDESPNTIMISSSAAVASSTLVPTANPVVVTEGPTIPAMTLIGSFTDNGGAKPVGSYSTSFVSFPGATANTPLALTQVGTSNTFTVRTAAATSFTAGGIDEGFSGYTLTISDNTGNSATTSGLLTVNDAPLSTTVSNNVNAVEGQPVSSFVLLNFNDGNTAAPASDFTATIDWGDGTPQSVGTVVGLGGGAFTVAGTHTYAEESPVGGYVITTTVRDKGGQTLVATSKGIITDAALSLPVGIPVSGSAGQSLAGVPLGTFADANPLATASDFTAMIDWGDNSAPSLGFVNLIGGNATLARFSVSGSHQYTAAGTFPVTVMVTDAGGQQVTIHTTATVTASALSVSVLPLSATEGQPTPAGKVVATFTDAAGPQPVGNFAVTIDWGDNTPVDTVATGVVVVSDGGGNFSIKAPAHTFAEEGGYVVTVTVTDTVNGSGPTTAANMATVKDAALTPINGGTFNASQGTALTVSPLVSFTDANPKAPLSDFTATIDWGDGTSSPGAISQPGGLGTTFAVAGTHTYAKPGSFPVAVSILDEGGSKASATATVNVAAATVTVNAVPLVISGVQNSPLIDVDVATFTSGNPSATAADFVATINWGDNTGSTAGTIVRDAGGTFHVQGTHTYTAAGHYTAVVSIGAVGSNGAPAQVNATANIAASPLSVTAVPVVATEGVALDNAPNVLNGTVVATFIDQTGAGPLSDYTATIDWGNGQVTPGVIVLDGPNFAVIAPATPAIIYPDEGTSSIRVTVTAKDANSGAGFFSAYGVTTATVLDADLTADPTQPQVNAFQQTPLVGVQVAKFTDGNPTAPVTDFSATIDWGDGGQSAGQVVQPGGAGTAFFVTGNHTYAQPTTPPNQPYVVTVTIRDVGGKTVVTRTIANVTASTITGTPVTINATEGQPFSNAIVAYFTDSGNPSPIGSYTATIDWGTGAAPVIGAIVPLGGSNFAVQGSFTYPEENVAPNLPYSITVAISHNGLPAATVVSHAQVADAPIQGVAVPAFATEGAQFKGTVAIFTDQNPAGAVGDFTATIDWGDGTQSAGTIVANGTSFLVTGADPVSHLGKVYAEEGTYVFTVTVRDVGGSSFSAFQTATVADAALTATPVTATAPEFPAFSGVVATFTDADPAGVPGDYRATIQWGDGLSSAGTISIAPNGDFQVNGTHLYDAVGTYTATVLIQDVGGSQATALSTIIITDLPLTPGTPVALTSVEGQAFTAVTVGTFTDANPNAVIADFTATIDWGDGTPVTAGIIGQLANGTFTVTGTHTYIEESAPGTPYAITVSVKDIGGSTATLHATAAVSDAALASQGTTIAATEGIAATDVTVATFTDADPFGTTGDFTATIDWGDGTAPTTGTVVATGTSPNGTTFRVTGTHTYAEEGPYQTQVTVTDVGGSKTVAVGTANVGDAALTATGVTVTAPIFPAFSGVIAKFTDANPGAPLSDFTATIDWGDGITSPGIVAVNPAGGFQVSGTHLYGAVRTYSATVLIQDVGGSKTTAVSSITITDVPITPGTPIALTSVEGQPFTAQVATFTNTNPNSVIADFTATIDWGDGTATSPGIIGQLANGTFTVTGTHTYTEESAAGTPYAITVSIKDIGGSTATAHATAAVSDAPLSSQGSTVTATVGTALVDVPVATFTDANPFGTAADFTVVINWGDGTATTSGKVVAAGTSPTGVTFTALGSHTYTAPGNYQTQVVITDDGGSQTVAFGHAVVAAVPAVATPIDFTIAEGQQYSGPVAFFFQNFGPPTGLRPASDYTATIDWGDGTPPTAGTINDVPGGHQVLGVHTYADARVNGGSNVFPVSVTINSIDDVFAKVLSHATVLDVPINLSGQLDPATDTGASNVDAITKINQPTFFGHSEPNSTVQLFAAPSGSNSPTMIGQTQADSSGAWSIITSLLADGSYTISVTALDAAGFTTGATQLLPNPKQGPLVIDTVGPKVTDVMFGRSTGQVLVTFQDDRSGMYQYGLVDASNYQLKKRNLPFGSLLVTSLPINFSDGPSTPVSVSVTINGGRRLPGGRYTFTIHSGGVADIAGNALDGEYYQYFPSGNNMAGGSFVAILDSIHHTVFAPRTVIGPASPVVPPGRRPHGFRIPTDNQGVHGRSLVRQAAVKPAHPSGVLALGKPSAGKHGR
jgi:hypothetical protein